MLTLQHDHYHGSRGQGVVSNKEARKHIIRAKEEIEKEKEE